MSEQLLLTVKEAAKSLRVCEKTLYLLTAPRGPIQPVRFNTNVRYSPDELRKFIEAHTQGAQR